MPISSKKGPQAAHAALAKHRASIARDVAQALEEVGSYTTNEVTFLVAPTPTDPSSLPMEAILILFYREFAANV